MLVTEETFHKIIEDTWASTLDFQICSRLSADLAGEGEIAVCVGISGKWNGEVYLRCPLPLGRLIASAIFQTEGDSASRDEIVDALSELIHIVGGNLKALLPQPVTVSLPFLVDPITSQYSVQDSRTVCQLTLGSAGYTFEIALKESPSTGGLEPIPIDREHTLPAEAP